MSKKMKRVITLVVTILFLISTLIGSFFLVKNSLDKAKEKEQIENVIEIYSNNVQERLEDEENNTNEKNNIKEDLLIQINGEDVIGVIKIEKINFEGLVYEGTSLATIDKGVGHFEISPYFDGNVCLAAHNSDKFWANLHTLQGGDEITYVSFLGTRTYKVSSIEEISETDWSKLANTNSNILTLITCVKNKPAKRLCVQAIEAL